MSNFSFNNQNNRPNSPLSAKMSISPNVICSLKRKRPPRIQIPGVLNEIDINFDVFSPSKDDSKSVVNCVDDGCVGLFCVKGKKKFMEDTFKFVSSINGDFRKGFFGVYDGHGGGKAAEFVSESLHKNIIEMVDNCEGRTAKEEAVKSAYLRTDSEFLEQDVGSGACCVTVLIDGSEMLVSNLGDCRAVLSRGGLAEALTKDHRAEREDERKRIEDKGGYVEFHKGAWRVHGILSVSRSIGDAHLKSWVVSEPDTTILDLTDDMDFLVLASDGLWDEVGCQEAIDTVQKSSRVEKTVHLPFDDLDNRLHKSLDENNNEYICVSSNSSPKVRRVSLVKQKQTTPLSLTYRKKNGISEFDTENESPPAKLRRTALFSRKSIKSQSPNQENTRPKPEGLSAACKELANLAVSRGSLDDITVMVVDLKHFRQAAPGKTSPIAL